MSLADRRLCHTLTAEHGTDGRFGWQSAIWFTNTFDAGNLPNNTVGVYSTENEQIHIIQLQKEYPLDFAIYNNLLLVAHYDLVKNEGGGITIYNIDNSQMAYFDLGHSAQQITIKGAELYILSDGKVYI